jgi:putative ATPase
LLARETESEFLEFSAVTTGIAEIKKIIAATSGKLFSPVVFIDEIHRFNKAQQDAFLPMVESGQIILIGATTENPSFEVNSALLSRCRVFVLEKLGPTEMQEILERALKDRERGLGEKMIEVDPQVLEKIVALADGDARTALNTLEMLVQAEEGKGRSLHGVEMTKAKVEMTKVKVEKTKGEIVLNLESLASLLQRDQHVYDKNGEEHYTIISALHKSLRVFICADPIDRKEVYKLSEHPSKDEAGKALAELWRKLNHK